MNKVLLRTRAGHCCEYCRDPEKFSLAAYHAEHIIPRQHGGGNDSENLALACPDCNHLKGPNLATLDADSGALTPLFHPRHDLWNDHFEKQGLLMNGRTAAGRGTVTLLDLNHPARQRHRAVLQALGEW